MSASAKGLFTVEGALVAALLLLLVLGMVDPLVQVLAVALSAAHRRRAGVAVVRP